MAERTLQSLADFNAAQLARWEKMKTLSPNGIACPQCGTECVESASQAVAFRKPVISGEPPTWLMQCSACDWTGSRVVA